MALARRLVSGDVRHHDRDERDARADGEIELTGDEQQRCRRRDDPEDRDRGQDVEPVFPLEEVWRLDSEEHELRRQEDEECADLGHGEAAAARRLHDHRLSGRRRDVGRQVS